MRERELSCCKHHHSLARISCDLGNISNNPLISLSFLVFFFFSRSALSQQLHNLREQLSVESTRLREIQETSSCRIRAEECQRTSLEEKLEKACSEAAQLRDEHISLSDYLVRLARALCWSDCADPPAHGSETHLMAESLLERAERMAIHQDHHEHHDVCDKSCFELPASHHHHHHLPKLRRERSCHDMPLKEVRSI